VARELTGLDTDGALDGPEGWLAFEPGMLVHVRIAGGRLVVSPGDEPDAASRLAARGIAAQARTRLDDLAADCAALRIPSALKQWLDESIPALGGLTPRQAAADKAGRRELDALLKDLEWSDRKAGPRHANQGTMDPARLRAMLGL
jgi:hypothetical protein